MLLDIIEVKNRLESPNNLMNRLAELRSNSNSRHSSKALIPSIPTISQAVEQPKINDLIEDIEDKLARGNSKSHAILVMNRCLAKLETVFDEVPATKLATVAKDMSQVLRNLEPTNSDNVNVNQVQFHVYSPEIRNESEFHVISVAD